MPVNGDEIGADKYFSRAVAKAFEVLEVVQSSQEPIAVNELARHVGLSKTSTFRLLRTLHTTGYLALTDGGQYQIAQGVRCLGPTQSLAKLVRLGTPYLQHITRELRETASLAVLFDNHIEVVAVVESPQLLRMSNVVGNILPPNASSLGKAITAFQTTARREKLIRSFGIYRFTPDTITDANELNQEFERVRAGEFAIDREESVLDGICFGVPVFGGPGRSVSAAISMSSPKSRVPDAGREKAIVQCITAETRKLTAELAKA